MRSIKKITIIITTMVLILGVGITYSLLTSSAKVIVDQKIAKFIFNAEPVNNIELPLIDLKPGEEESYLFSVSNSEEEEISEVTIEYQIVLKTFHLAPFDIKLYKIDGENEELILDCDESYSRNEQNELVCNIEIQTMGHGSASLDEYRLEVLFPSEFKDISYSEIVDYISLDIKSWQKV